MFTIAGTEVTFFNFIHIYIESDSYKIRLIPFFYTQVLKYCIQLSIHLTRFLKPIIYFFSHWQLLLFVLFLLAITLSVLIWLTDSDYLPLVSSNSSAPKFTFSKKHFFYIMWSHFLLKLDNPNVIAFSTHLSMISSNYSIKF